MTNTYQYQDVEQLKALASAQGGQRLGSVKGWFAEKAMDGLEASTPDALFDYLTGKAPSEWTTAAGWVLHGRFKEMAFLGDNDAFKKGLFEAFQDSDFKQSLSKGGANGMDADKLEGVFKQVEAAGPEAQAAVNNALSNPDFIKHIMSGNGGALMNEDTLKEALQGQHKGFAIQLLNQIGTNPMFQGADADKGFAKLDKLGAKIGELGEETKKLDAIKDEKEKKAQREKIMQMQLAMAGDMRELGVNVPEDVTADILGTFKNIFMYGMSTEQAMDDLMVQLAKKGIDPKAIESLDAMMRPMAGMMDFIAKPYSEFFRKHGGTLMDNGNSLIGHVDNIQRGLFNGEGFVSDPAQREANVLKFQADIKARDEGMDGAAKRVKLAETFGLKSDKDGNLSVEQERANELSAMDAQRRMNPTPAFSIGGP